MVEFIIVLGLLFGTGLCAEVFNQYQLGFPALHGHNEHNKLMDDLNKYQLFADVGRKLVACELVEVDKHGFMAKVRLVSGSIVSVKVANLTSFLKADLDKG